MPDFTTPAFAAILLMLTGAPPGDVAQAPLSPAVEAAPAPENRSSLEAKSKPDSVRRADTAGDVPDEKKPISALKCQVEINGGATQRSIVAMATASKAPQSGTFTLEIQKTGPNTSRSRQHGDFALAVGETKRLAKVRMSVGASESFSGRLLLNTKDGETVCEIK